MDSVLNAPPICAARRSRRGLHLRNDPDGTNAQLHDWLRLQGCAGARRIFLRDERSLDADATAVARWMFEPFVEAGTLVLLNASAAASSTIQTPLLCRSLKVSGRRAPRVARR